MKKCNKCGLSKSYDEYHNSKSYSDGKNVMCKVCKSEKSKRYYEKNSEHVKKRILDNYYDDREKHWGRMCNYYKENRDDLLEYKSEYYERNKEHMLELSSVYYKENKEDINEKNKLYMCERRKTDKLFVLKETISSLIYHSLRRSGYKRNKRTMDVLGCTIQEFKDYIESLFVDGMSWDNKGEWHIDHKRPVGWAKDEEEIYELNHYTNLQPMWGIDNIRKGNRYES
jgi:hypothetical protein